jgi:hypothetical protein
MIVHLFCTFVFAIGSVIFGWSFGHVGWISLAFYSAGGLVGLLLACPILSLLGAQSADGDCDHAEDFREFAV